MRGRCLRRLRGRAVTARINTGHKILPDNEMPQALQVLLGMFYVVYTVNTDDDTVHIQLVKRMFAI